MSSFKAGSKNFGKFKRPTETVGETPNGIDRNVRFIEKTDRLIEQLIAKLERGEIVTTSNKLRRELKKIYGDRWEELSGLAVG